MARDVFTTVRSKNRALARTVVSGGIRLLRFAAIIFILPRQSWPPAKVPGSYLRLPVLDHKVPTNRIIDGARSEGSPEQAAEEPLSQPLRTQNLPHWPNRWRYQWVIPVWFQIVQALGLLAVAAIGVAAYRQHFTAKNKLQLDQAAHARA